MITQVGGEQTDSAQSNKSSVSLGQVGIGLAAFTAILGLWGASRARTADVDGYGLISALPTTYWVAIVLGVVTTVVLLWVSADSGNRRYATPVPILWLSLLHTGTQFAHDHVRFGIVWTHMGFIRLISERGEGEILIDARFAWPGFFGTFTAPFVDLEPWLLESLLRLWPTYITGGTAVLVGALARRAYPHVQNVGSFSALAYVLLAWTGQDYFSPQSVGFLWFIAILVIIESGPLVAGEAWSSSIPVLNRFATSGGDRPDARSTPAFVSLIILSFGAVVSHPLAPFFVCMALAILGLYGRTVAWRLLMFVGAAYAIWFLVSAEPWWSTRVAELTEQLGSFGANVFTGTTERVQASSPEHLFVTDIRSYVGLATFGFVFLVGVTMGTERFKHLRPAVPLAPLAGVAVMAVFLQSYGGEIIIRVLLFTLPMASILIGRVLALLRPRTLPIVAAVFAAVMTPLFMIARFGNESFEYTTAVDREAVVAAYEAADDDTLFVADNGFISWRDETIGRNHFTQRKVAPTEEYIAKLEQIAIDRGKERIIIVLTQSQAAWRVHGESDDPEILDEFARWALNRPGSELLYRQDGAWAIEL